MSFPYTGITYAPSGLYLAIAIGVDARRMNEIVLGKSAITADTALRLSRILGNSTQIWMGLQSQYDLDLAQDQLGNG